MTEEKGGSMLRGLRKARKRSMESIAGDAGITYKTLSDIERNVTKQPAREILQRILEALHQVHPLAVADQQTVMVAYVYSSTKA